MSHNGKAKHLFRTLMMISAILMASGTRVSSSIHRRVHRDTISTVRGSLKR